MKRLILLVTVYMFYLCILNGNFIRVKDNFFYINDQPYLFVGINYWQGPYLAANYIPGGRERLIRELDLMKSYGITNLRIMASSENSIMIKSLKPAFQEKPYVLNERLLDGLDFLLYELAKRNMKAVLVLNNYWQWSGGMAQYNSWTMNNFIVDPDKTGNYLEFMKFSAEFYSNELGNVIFRNFIHKLINRYNKYSKVVYKNDPTIMSWQLANEPRPHPSSKNDTLKLNTFCKWIEETAKYIRSIDPNHLISTGNEGLAGCLWDSSIVIKLNKIPNIDYITIHLWPKNWRWFNECIELDKMKIVIEKANEYLNFHLELAKLIKKPIVIEEFGIDRDSCNVLPGTSVISRDIFLKNIFLRIEESLLQNIGFCGSNIWTWAGEGRPNTKIDFTGDPPQELKGLNSIYDTDFSTLKVILEHHKNLEALKAKIK